MAVKRKYRLNLRNYGNLPAIMLSQYDEGYALEFEIRDGTDAASDLSAYTVTLKGTRADTLAYSFAGTISTNVLTFVIDTTMTACAGRGTAEIAIKDTANDVLFATFNMPVFVERAAVPEGSIDADVERAQEIAEQVQEIVDNAAATVSGEAEKWATGQIDGTDVPSTDPAYENNAKYYAEQAADSAASIGIDATLTQSGKAADAKKTGDEITALKEDLTQLSETTLLNGFTEVTEAGYYGDSGEVISSTTFKYSEVYVKIKPNTKYSIWWARFNTSYYTIGSSIGVVFYDKDKNFIIRMANTQKFTTPANAEYMRTYLGNSVLLGAMLVEGETMPDYFIPYGYDLVTAYEEKSGGDYYNSFSNGSNLLNAVTLTDHAKEYVFDDETEKTITSGVYVNAINVPVESASWNTYTCAVEPNSIYHYKCTGSIGCYGLMVFDKKGHRLAVAPSSLVSGTIEGEIYIPSTADHVVINAESAITPSFKKAIGITYKKGDILNGKKLYCGGDSITEGANVGSFPNGYKKTYGGVVATRNNMVYVSDGVGGSTMGKCTIDGSVHNNFITSRYLNIPTDADFITLWFGWNDNAYGWKSERDAYCVSTYEHYYSELTEEQQEAVDAYKTWRQWLAEYAGTKDSTEITTWGGAWNTVLTWLLNNCGSSRIGVIIAYGMNTELSDVLIAICEKYGVSYVKAYDPHEFFSVGHSQNIGTDQATKRKALYTLDNTHPNELGYEMMSDSYEQFLKRL